MVVRRCSLAVMTAVLMISAAFAQAPNPEPGQNSTPMPVVSFELNWREADPQWYSISIEPTGRASYRSQPKAEPGETAGDPFMMDFTASEPTRTSVFELAKRAKYFKGDFDSKIKNIAKTGEKTLRYKDATKDNETVFNYSTDPAISELTTLFQRISATMEAGRKLAYAIRFDKLGVDARLKQMEQMKNSGSLAEVQALEPLLKQIIDDRSFMNVSRQRAQKILGVSVSPSGSRR